MINRLSQHSASPNYFSPFSHTTLSPHVVSGKYAFSPPTKVLDYR